MTEVLKGLDALSTKQYVSPWLYVGVYSGTGNVAAWRQAVQDSYEQRANGSHS